MNNKKYEISSIQFFVMLCLSQIFSFITLGAYTFDLSLLNVFLPGLAISAVIAAAFYGYTFLPFEKVRRCFEKSKLKSLINAVFAVYFVYLSVRSLLIIAFFLRSEINPEASLIFVSLLVLSCCIYSAYRGFEGLSRASVILLFFSVLCVLLLVAGTSKNIELDNFSMLSAGSFGSVTKFVLYFVSNQFYIVLVSLYFKNVKGNLKRGAFVSLGAVYVFFCAMFFLLVLIFQRYGQTVSFPFYSLAKSGEIGVITNLGVLCLSLIVMSGFVKISLLLNGAHRCCAIKKRKKEYTVLFIICALLLLAACYFDFLKSVFMNEYVLLSFTLVCVILTPFVFSKERTEKFEH